MRHHGLLKTSLGGADTDLDLGRFGERDLARLYSINRWEALLAAAAAILALAARSSASRSALSPSPTHSIQFLFSESFELVLDSVPGPWMLVCRVRRNARDHAVPIAGA